MASRRWRISWAENVVFAFTAMRDRQRLIFGGARRIHMLPIFPSEILFTSWEMICCALSTAAAVMSYWFVSR